MHICSYFASQLVIKEDIQCPAQLSLHRAQKSFVLVLEILRARSSKSSCSFVKYLVLGLSCFRSFVLSVFRSFGLSFFRARALMLGALVQMYFTHSVRIKESIFLFRNILAAACSCSQIFHIFVENIYIHIDVQLIQESYLIVFVYQILM